MITVSTFCVGVLCRLCECVWLQMSVFKVCALDSYCMCRYNYAMAVVRIMTVVRVLMYCLIFLLRFETSLGEANSGKWKDFVHMYIKLV